MSSPAITPEIRGTASTARPSRILLRRRHPPVRTSVTGQMPAPESPVGVVPARSFSVGFGPARTSGRLETHYRRWSSWQAPPGHGMPCLSSADRLGNFATPNRSLATNPNDWRVPVCRERLKSTATRFDRAVSAQFSDGVRPIMSAIPSTYPGDQRCCGSKSGGNPGRLQTWHKILHAVLYAVKSALVLAYGNPHVCEGLLR
jgi:hypothetical protein